MNTCPNDDKDITGKYIISPESVDWFLHGLLYLLYLTSLFGSFLRRQTCVYIPNTGYYYMKEVYFYSFVAGYPNPND